jgi:hypothetical protein
VDLLYQTLGLSFAFPTVEDLSFLLFIKCLKYQSFLKALTDPIMEENLNKQS